VGQFTTFFWTVNALSLMNFLNLRNSPHAQAEIQAYAEVIEEMFAARMPWTHAAFRAHWGPSMIR
jgi:thymidylate synthase (FAD)